MVTQEGRPSDNVAHPVSDWYLYGHKNPKHAHTRLIKRGVYRYPLSTLLSTLSSSFFPVAFGPAYPVSNVVLCPPQLKYDWSKLRRITTERQPLASVTYVGSWTRLFVDRTPAWVTLGEPVSRQQRREGERREKKTIERVTDWSLERKRAL